MRKKKRRILIMGAAGRDFHNFNVFFRDNPSYEVAAFTAAQIPDIAGRTYPPELAGRLYPKGIPIYPEEKLPELIRKKEIDEVVLAYSDLPHMHVMHKASLVNACGADFTLLGPKSTMLRSRLPVIAVGAVRTGCGKSETTQRICEILQSYGVRAVVIRHPMPYGDLRKQAVQRFAAPADLDRHSCTIEEREEYEPHIDAGRVVYAGVDYGRILRAAEREADVIVWDGGNNDFPFIQPDLFFVLADPLRPWHEITYYPGEMNLRLADVIIINKERSAKPRAIQIVEANSRKYNPGASILHADSKITVREPQLVKGRRVLVIEDGPTLTHGGMTYGAGLIAARRMGATPVDPRRWAVGSLAEIFKKYRRIGPVLPAMGYSPEQVGELERTINAVEADAIVSATPINLQNVLKTDKPIVRITYELEVKGKHLLRDIISGFIASNRMHLRKPARRKR